MRLKYGKPWSKQEREEFREIVWTNILDGAKVSSLDHVSQLLSEVRADPLY